MAGRRCRGGGACDGCKAAAGVLAEGNTTLEAGCAGLGTRRWAGNAAEGGGGPPVRRVARGGRRGEERCSPV